MKGKHLEFVAGIVIGGVLFGGGAAYAAGLLAEPSTQTFYLDGRQIQLEAYDINGYNYVKLRDVGQAVDFNVAYVPVQNAVIIQSDKPYTGENIVVPVPGFQADGAVDYASQANPTVFTGGLTREIYNVLRDAVTHREEIIAGTYHTCAIGPVQEVDTVTAMRLVRALSGGTIDYAVLNDVDGSTKNLSARYNEEYEAAIDHVRPFLESISHLSQREQVREMVWYIADRMTYSMYISALPSQILAQDEIMKEAGNCMTYSSSLRFLCEQAGIPCILVSSDIHQWNMVYLNGAWWHVDPTAEKGNIETVMVQKYSNGAWGDVQGSEAERAAVLQGIRDRSTVFYQTMEGTTYEDANPEDTQFLKELLVPGSTK